MHPLPVARLGFGLVPPHETRVAVQRTICSEAIAEEGAARVDHGMSFGFLRTNFNGLKLGH